MFLQVAYRNWWDSNQGCMTREQTKFSLSYRAYWALEDKWKTSFALWSCSSGSNPIYSGMPLVETPILVFGNHDKYIFIKEKAENKMMKSISRKLNILIRKQTKNEIDCCWLNIRLQFPAVYSNMQSRRNNCQFLLVF